jgi:tetratricopeptide (TPR) repeat protein
LEDLYAEALQLIDTLLVEAPGEFQYVHLRGRILSNRGLHETVWDDHDVAIETFREAVRVREKLAEDQPAVRKHQEGLATSLGNLAEAYRRGGRLQESIGPRERGIDICKKLLAKHKSEPSLRTDLATEVVRLAYTFHLMKDDQRAVESLRHASEVGVRLEHGEPDSLRQCYFAAVCYALVAATSTDAERGVATEKAIALLRRAWELAYFDRPDNVKLFADEEAFQALEGSREFQALKQEILSKRPANDGQVNTGKPVASQ